MIGFVAVFVAGIAVDEWTRPDYDPRVGWATEGLREAKRRHPEMFIAVWVTRPTPVFRKLLAEGTVDLALIEGYTHVPDHPEWAIPWQPLIDDRIELMKREGLLHKTIACLGQVVAEPDSLGKSMTPDELTRQVEHIARAYPEMPGIAFYGNKGGEATRELAILADELAERLYPRGTLE